VNREGAMSFRRQKDEWREFLHRHQEELRACGVPHDVWRDQQRLFVFLDHGFDQWGWAENPHACFNSDILTDDQIGRLAAFVAGHFGEQYRVRIASRWMRDR
jgi:hypothetical protein